MDRRGLYITGYLARRTGWFNIVSDMFVLIPGRTSKQGVGISEGKFGDTYQSETTTLLVAPEDMERLRLQAGNRVRITSDHGQVIGCSRTWPENWRIFIPPVVTEAVQVQQLFLATLSVSVTRRLPHEK